VRNITVSLDDETYRRARIRAAALDTSVSSLVRQFLAELAAVESEAERLKRQERALRARVIAFRGGERLRREQVHDREA
jgi:plasmid stability protein